MNTNPSSTAFILDFDGTITQKDTISTIANFAIAFHKARGKDLQDTWTSITDTYVESYARYLQAYKPAREDRKTLADEISYLRQLKSIEEASFGLVSHSGIFRDIADEQWRQGGREAVRKGDVKIQKGFEDFIEKVRNSGATWVVLSVNFSSQFIRGALEASLGEAEAAEVQVLANSPDEQGILRGPNDGPVMATSDAKLAAMNDILQQWKSKSKADFSRIVYVGDSGTDLECLTAEGVVGIVITGHVEERPYDGRATSTIDTLKRIGLDPLHISSKQEGIESSLYWARDFEEITRSLLFDLDVLKGL